MPRSVRPAGPAENPGRGQRSRAAARPAVVRGSVSVKVVPCALDADEVERAAVRGRDGLGDGQAETHAGDGVALRGGGAEEAGEQLALLAGGDADAGVADRQLGDRHRVRALGVADRAVRRSASRTQREGHPAAGGRELHGVGDEVVARLTQPDGVTGDDERRPSGTSTAISTPAVAAVDARGLLGGPDDAGEVDVLAAAA